jgi:TPR repeat protein
MKRLALLLPLLAFAAAPARAEDPATNAPPASPEELIATARRCLDGLPDELDFARGVELLREAAAAGSAEAVVRLGACSDEGTGVPRDVSRALELYREAAGKGCDLGKIAVAMYRLRGLAEEPDAHEAFRRLSALGKAGDPFARLALAQCRTFGIGGVPRDPEKAARHASRAAEAFRPGAEAGDTERQQGLAVALFAAGGFSRDGFGKAEPWFEAAAARGDPGSNEWLLKFAIQSREFGVDPAKRRLWAERAQTVFEARAAQGAPRAMLALGRIERHGLVGEPDAEAAVAWFRRAADAGHPEALYELGRAYETGDGVPRDEARACDFLGRSGEKRQPEALLRLARLDLAAGDAAAARRRLREAAKLSAWPARDILDGMERDRRVGPAWARVLLDTIFEGADHPEAKIDWNSPEGAEMLSLRLKAAQGDAGAQLGLGDRYRRGDGAPRGRHVLTDDMLPQLEGEPVAGWFTWGVSLGRAGSGLPQGTLDLRWDAPETVDFSQTALRPNWQAEERGVRIVEIPGGRQARADTCLAILTNTPPVGFEVVFFGADDVRPAETNAAGEALFWEPLPAAKPLSRNRFSRPAPGADGAPPDRFVQETWSDGKRTGALEARWTGDHWILADRMPGGREKELFKARTPDGALTKRRIERDAETGEIVSFDERSTVDLKCPNWSFEEAPLRHVSWHARTGTFRTNRTEWTKAADGSRWLKTAEFDEDGLWTRYRYDDPDNPDFETETSGGLDGSDRPEWRTTQSMRPFLPAGHFPAGMEPDLGSRSSRRPRVRTCWRADGTPASKTLCVVTQRRTDNGSTRDWTIETLELADPAETNLLAAWDAKAGRYSLVREEPFVDLDAWEPGIFSCGVDGRRVLEVEDDGTAHRWSHTRGDWTPPGPDGAPGAFSPNPKGGFLRIVETVGTREQLGVGPHGLDLPAATNRLEGVPGVNRQEIEVWDIAERKRVEHTESAKKGKPK